MNTKVPIWNLKAICPCCGQGFPILTSCPKCSFVTAHCEEIGDTFKDPKALTLGFISCCPTCHTKTEDFNPASSERILEAGFTKEDYE